MNHPFVEMLRYELKSNYMLWILNLIIGVGLITTYYFLGNNHNSIVPIFTFPVFMFLTWIFTINSYNESIKSQSMQMYHLIPVSRNSKFISKQFVTLIAFPLLLVLLTALFVGIMKVFVTTSTLIQESGSHNLQGRYFPIIFIFGHSISTFFAIIFKKNKILYAIIVYFGIQFIMSIIIAGIFLLFFKNLSFKISNYFIGQDTGTWIVFVSLLLSAVLYGFSYRLFFRRQL